ncbi:MAG: ABC transporter substrate-binding protein [Phycisphaerae bacterium]|nr:ABC transporter substrate-binding protein [Phycisphaerae bacterium]
MQARWVQWAIVWAVGFAVLLSGCKKSPDTQFPASASAAKRPDESDSIKVGGIFAVTGGPSLVGGPQARTAEMFVETINQAGGVAGRKIELLLRDSAGRAENAISLAKQLIDEEQVLAIVGPSTSGETMAIKNLCQENRTILLACAAAEDIVNPLASYVFKTSQKDSDAVRRIYRVMKDLRISRVGVLTSNDGFGRAGAAQLHKIAPEYGITVAGYEVYDEQETSLTGLLTKIKSLDVQSIVNWSVVPAQSLVAKNMKQIELNVPLFQSQGFGNIKYAQAAGEAANGTIFPCGRLLVADLLPDSDPHKRILIEYKRQYESRHQEPACNFGGNAYDGLLILTKAIEKAGSTDREQVRAAIETLDNVLGISGPFHLSQQDHNGLAEDTFEMILVKDGQFTIYQP